MAAAAAAAREQWAGSCLPRLLLALLLPLALAGAQLGLLLLRRIDGRAGEDTGARAPLSELELQELRQAVAYLLQHQRPPPPAPLFDPPPPPSSPSPTAATAAAAALASASATTSAAAAELWAPPPPAAQPALDAEQLWAPPVAMATPPLAPTRELRACAPGCERHGTCDPRTGECHCPLTRTGTDADARPTTTRCRPRHQMHGSRALRGPPLVSRCAAAAADLGERHAQGRHAASGRCRRAWCGSRAERRRPRRTRASPSCRWRCCGTSGRCAAAAAARSFLPSLARSLRRRAPPRLQEKAKAPQNKRSVEARRGMFSAQLPVRRRRPRQAHAPSARTRVALAADAGRRRRGAAGARVRGRRELRVPAAGLRAAGAAAPVDLRHAAGGVHAPCHPLRVAAAAAARLERAAARAERARPAVEGAQVRRGEHADAARGALVPRRRGGGRLQVGRAPRTCTCRRQPLRA
eukprot:scaffold1326_cov296-Prasinococcus_capsulatus_cf.AAC.7